MPDFVRQSVPNTPFITAAEAGLPKSLRRTDTNNINPRFGVAWRPFGDSRTVIRGGVGLYTVPLLGSVNYSMVATVTAAAVNFANTPLLHLSFRRSPRLRRRRARFPGNAGLPPRKSDRHERSTHHSVDSDIRARPWLEYRSAGQLRGVEDERSRVEPGSESSAGKHAQDTLPSADQGRFSTGTS